MATADPGLFGAVLIALASGWIARRLLLRPPGVFACLALGVAGALLGVMAAWTVGLPVTGAPGLLAAATGGALFILSLWVMLARR